MRNTRNDKNKVTRPCACEMNTHDAGHRRRRLPLATNAADRACPTGRQCMAMRPTPDTVAIRYVAASVVCWRSNASRNLALKYENPNVCPGLVAIIMHIATRQHQPAVEESCSSSERSRRLQSSSSATCSATNSGVDSSRTSAVDISGRGRGGRWGDRGRKRSILTSSVVRMIQLLE